MNTTYTVSNIAGGDLRSFRLDKDGQLSGASIRHIKRIGFGGPQFGGPAGETASDLWDRLEDELAELDE